MAHIRFDHVRPAVYPRAVSKPVRPESSTSPAPFTPTTRRFGGYGVNALSDQVSRTAEALVATFAKGLAEVSRDAVLAVSPDHARLFRGAGWSRAKVITALRDLLGRDASNVLLVHAGGPAGLFSALLPGWVGGAEGSQPVTRPIHD